MKTVTKNVAHEIIWKMLLDVPRKLYEKYLEITISLKKTRGDGGNGSSSAFLKYKVLLNTC